MDFCQLGYLNIFVTPAPEGYGLDVTIKAYLATDKRLTHKDVWDKIQVGSFDAVVKSLSADNIKTIMEWMVAAGQIGRPETQTITYTEA